MADAAHVEFGPGRFGRREGAPGLVVRDLQDFALATVIARRGQVEAAAGAAERAFGVALPTGPRAVAGRGVGFIGTGPGQWLALAAEAPEPIETRLHSALGELVSVFDQGDSRVMLELSGPRVRDVLAKGFAIDLHPRRFPTGQAALTTAAHVAVQLWQTSDAPTYRLLTVRTWFGSFWNWLASSAAEHGAQVLAPARYPADGAAP